MAFEVTHWHQRIFHSSTTQFEQLSLEAFRYQFENNALYASFCRGIGCVESKVSRIEDIPFLPISFFKSHLIKSSSWQPEQVFYSSGTTKGTEHRSKHYIRDLALYTRSLTLGFERFFGPPEQFHFLCLLPSYLENKNASLVYMMRQLMQRSNSPLQGFFLNDHEKLFESAEAALKKGDRRVFLMGVSFALLDFSARYKLNLQGHIVLETGGMKGKRKEMIRAELHDSLSEAFSVPEIYSEYGMTELLSQAYSCGSEGFQSPPWMRILLRDQLDPTEVNANRQDGGVNVIDLANIHSCCFIETEDLGRRLPSGNIEVLGRSDYSDVRGCSLLAY